MNSYYIKEKQGSMLDMLKAIYSRFNSLVKEAKIIQYNNDIYLSHVDSEYELKECIKVSTLVSDAQEWLLCLESFVIDRCPNYINEHGINKYINKTIVPMINKCMESIIQLNEEVNTIKTIKSYIANAEGNHKFNIIKGSVEADSEILKKKSDIKE